MSDQQARPPRDAGSATVQAALTMPLLGLLVFAVVQFALYFHALQIAQTAADEGLDSARISGASDADGQARAAAFLQAMAGGALHGESVQVSRTSHDVTVQVSGTAEQVVPFVHLGVEASAVGPIEQTGTP